MAQAAKLRLKQRRSLQEPLKIRKTDLPEQELVYNKDPHYRTWDQRVGEEKLTYPVDRDWVFTRNRMISGILKTGIRSTIGGEVIMIVDRDHFAAKGWKVILPKGTEMICQYQPLANVHDRQIPFRCTEAIRPDGARLLFDSHGKDSTGYNGLIGTIDWRSVERYGAAFTMAGLSALADASSARLQRNQTLQQSSTQLSNNLGQVTAEVIDQNLDLTPVITIEPGTRVHISPTTDIWLRPPLSRQEVEALKTIEAQQRAHRPSPQKSPQPFQGQPQALNTAPQQSQSQALDSFPQESFDSQPASSSPEVW